MGNDFSLRDRRRALIGLLIVTIIWGWTFVWMKQALDTVTLELGPGRAAENPAIGLFLVLRFGIAALLLPLFSKACRTRANFDRGLLRDAGLLGVLVLGGFLIQMLGLTDITPAVSAFLTSLYVIFTAFLALFSKAHRRISPALLIGVLLATLGAAFISGPPQLNFDLAEWLTVASAFLFAGTILVTDKATRSHAPTTVSLVSFVFVTLGAMVYLLWALARPGAPAFDELLGLLGHWNFAWPLAACSLPATLFALSLINHYQRMISPVRAAALYAFEPVWAACISIGYGTDTAGPWLLGGAAALLLGNLVAELGPRRKS